MSYKEEIIGDEKTNNYVEMRVTITKSDEIEELFKAGQEKRKVILAPSLDLRYEGFFQEAQT